MTASRSGVILGLFELGSDGHPIVEAGRAVGNLGPLLACARLVQSAAYAAGCPAAVFYTVLLQTAGRTAIG